jgi:hypothetical protein
MYGFIPKFLLVSHFYLEGACPVRSFLYGWHAYDDIHWTRGMLDNGRVFRLDESNDS